MSCEASRRPKEVLHCFPPKVCIEAWVTGAPSEVTGCCLTLTVKSDYGILPPRKTSSDRPAKRVQACHLLLIRNRFHSNSTSYREVVTPWLTPGLATAKPSSHCWAFSDVAGYRKGGSLTSAGYFRYHRLSSSTKSSEMRLFAETYWTYWKFDSPWQRTNQNNRRITQNTQKALRVY